MDFGLGTYDGMIDADFQFPKRKQIVLHDHKIASAQIKIGLEKWARKEWVGKFYPPRLKEKDFLDYYAQHFNSIELNATHYKLYSQESIQKWVSKVGDNDFIFCPKMYKGVTHHGSLRGKEFVTGEFFNAVNAFGKHLGPVFIQLPETFAPKRKNELFEFLMSLPKNFTYFLEIRHPEWFSSNELFEELSQTLRELKIGFIITDTAKRRDVVHMNLTIPQVFIRFCCNGDQELDKYRIQLWKNQLNDWFNKGLESCYFFLHIYNPHMAPEFAKYVQQELNEVIK
jgi:uncharacterized protein YecE (DUF72 family)